MRAKSLSLAVIAATFLSATPVSSVSAQGSWATYTNARFGYALCYPAHLLTPQREADNGDGRTFKGKNGAEMRVWGSNNALDITLEEQMGKASMWVSDPNPRAYPAINYRKLFDGYYIAAGHSRSEDSFEKTYLKDGSFLTVQIRYPQKDATIWKPIVRRITQCFKPNK